VAHLARLHLAPGEDVTFGTQLGQVLDYMAKLSELDVSGVEPTAHAIPLLNVFRPDDLRPGLAQAQALQNAPAQANGLFVVPRIVE
jgi:aspartyl-tRNA(Asn)/glutamyl-tRNA(Gln) amidotransferase subunit C